MKKSLLLFVPLLFLVGCSSSGGSAPAATAAAVTTDVIVGKMQVCTFGEKARRGQECYSPKRSVPYNGGTITQEAHWLSGTRWELTIRTPQGTTYTVETPFQDAPEPVLGQSWP